MALFVETLRIEGLFCRDQFGLGAFEQRSDRIGITCVRDQNVDVLQVTYFGKPFDGKLGGIRQQHHR